MAASLRSQPHGDRAFERHTQPDPRRYETPQRLVANPLSGQYALVPDMFSSSKPAAAILKVRSLPESLEWYQDAGFQVRGETLDLDATWAEVECENLVLHLLSGETPWEGDPVFTGSFYVYTSSVDRVYSEVKDKIAVEWGVEDRPWGSRELTLTDPNGYFVTFCQVSTGGSPA
jgi:uncharacterized glyoxalase superfamily protein PhnB